MSRKAAAIGLATLSVLTMQGCATSVGNGCQSLDLQPKPLAIKAPETHAYLAQLLSEEIQLNWLRNSQPYQQCLAAIRGLRIKTHPSNEVSAEAAFNEGVQQLESTYVAGVMQGFRQRQVKNHDKNAFVLVKGCSAESKALFKVLLSGDGSRDITASPVFSIYKQCVENQ